MGASSYCRDLVVAGLNRYAEFVELSLGFVHAGEHALRDDTEILIFEFLTLRRTGAEKGATSRNEIGAREVEITVDQEIFLLGTGGGRDHRNILVAEKFQDTASLGIEGLHGAQDRGLEIEGFTGPGNERGRDAEGNAIGVLREIARAGDVPRGVAAGFESGADAAGGKRGSVRFALDELLAGELSDGAAATVGLEEAVVLLGSDTGERLKNVSVV